MGKIKERIKEYLKIRLIPGIANLENFEGGISVEGGNLVFRLRGYFRKIPPPQKGGKNRKFDF